MRKPRQLQELLLGTAVMATVLCACVPSPVAPALYVAQYLLFVLLPLVAAIALQLCIVRQRLAEHIKVLRERQRFSYTKSEKRLHFPRLTGNRFHAIAELKSAGIHPNRAGPFPVFA